MENTYNVPEQNLSKLQSQIDKLARRCKRIGVQPPVMTVGAATDTRYKDADGRDMMRRRYAVTLVSVERPKIEGFEFIATLSPVANDDGTVIGNVLRAVPGASATPEERFRNAANYCDHCKTERFRLETFVITDGTTQRQIGRNCLANFLGLTNPHMLAALAQILIDLSDLGEMSEDDCFGGGRFQNRFPMSEVLATAASAIRNHGWLSNKSAREFGKASTSGRTFEWMTSNKEGREKFEIALTPSEADIALATETEEWLSTITDTTNDYMYNLSLLSQAASIAEKNFGIAVSAINAYSRAMEREIRRNARIESDKNSNFMGVVGERMTFENLTVVYTNTFESDFGVSHLYKMKTGDNVVVYFSSRDLGFEIGNVIPKFIAGVKNHEVRDGIKQTTITRGKEAPREMSKEEKRAVNKLKKIVKTIQYDNDGYAAHSLLDNLIADIKQNGFAIQSTEVTK